MALFGSSIIPIRVMNLVLGSVNALIVYLIIEKNWSQKRALFSGLVMGLFPVASIFDVLAMQDTLALTLVLSSLYYYMDHPFFSGILLALSGQSRTEFLLIGFFIVCVYFLVEGLSTDRLPFLIGWFITTFSFACFLYSKTGNPFYHLYWSLYNVFGGWDVGNQNRSFLDLMFSWVLWKLSVWPTKLTGIFILFPLISFAVTTFYLIRKRMKGYPFPVFFLSTLVVLSPSFVTYLWSNHEYLMIMLRMLNPIFSLFLLMIPILSRTDVIRSLEGWLVGLNIPYIVLLLILLSYAFFIPYYSRFQVVTSSAFRSADLALIYYDGGTIVCDYPTINYRLVNKGGVTVDELLGNHYAPNYYGISDPIEYARWFDENDISLWLYYDSRAIPVWSVVKENYPHLLIHIVDLPSARLYAVNDTLLDDIMVMGR